MPVAGRLRGSCLDCSVSLAIQTIAPDDDERDRNVPHPGRQPRLLLGLGFALSGDDLVLVRVPATLPGLTGPPPGSPSRRRDPSWLGRAPETGVENLASGEVGAGRVSSDVGRPHVWVGDSREAGRVGLNQRAVAAVVTSGSMFNGTFASAA